MILKNYSFTWTLKPCPAEGRKADELEPTLLKTRKEQKRKQPEERTQCGFWAALPLRGHRSITICLSYFCITATSTPHRYYLRNQGFRLVPGLRSSQPIMVGVACWSLYRRSSQGEGAGSRGHGQITGSTLQSLTRSNLLPPLRPHLLKAPEPSKHQYKQVFKTGAYGDIPDSNHAAF